MTFRMNPWKKTVAVLALVATLVTACIEISAQSSYASCADAACRDTRYDARLGRDAHGPRGVAALRDVVVVLEGKRKLRVYGKDGALKRTHALAFDAVRVYPGAANEVWVLSSFDTSFTLYRLRLQTSGALIGDPEPRQATRHMYFSVSYRDRDYHFVGLSDVALSADGFDLFVTARFRLPSTGETIGGVVHFHVWEDFTDASALAIGVQKFPFDWRKGTLSPELRIDVDDAHDFLYGVDPSTGEVTRFDFELEPLADMAHPLDREGAPGRFVQDFAVDADAFLVGVISGGTSPSYTYELRAYGVFGDDLATLDRTDTRGVNALSSAGVEDGVSCGGKPGGYVWQVTGAASGTSNTVVRHTVCDTRN